MPLSPDLVKFLPDQELIAAAQGQGSGAIPSFVALAELSSRTNIRNSSPIAPQRSTVAQQVVGNALAQQGIVSPASSAVAPNAPTASPVQTPQSFAGGGIVHMATGGESNADSAANDYQTLQTQLQAMGMLPSTASITPQVVTYNPTVTPDATTLDQSMAKVSPLFGKDPGYDQTLANLQGLRTPTPNQGIGNWLQNLVGSALGSKGNPTQAFGEGLMTANQLANQGQQQGFQNQMAKSNAIFNVQKGMDQRQRDIADAALQYRNANATIADAQDRMKTSVAESNASRQQQAQEDMIRANQERATALQKVMDSAGNPVIAGLMGSAARASGNTAVADVMDAAQSAYQQKMQEQSDIEQKREMAVEGARAANQMRAELAKVAAEHHYKMIEAGLINEDGTAKPDANGQTLMGVDGKPVVAHPDFGGPTWQAAASGLKGVDPNNRFDAAAVHWIETNEVPFKGQGAAMSNMAMQKRAQEIMAANGIQPDELTPIRAQYKANANSLTDLVKRNQQLQMSEKRIDNQFPNMMRAISSSNYIAPPLNSLINSGAQLLGGTGKIDRESAINPIVSEYAAFMNGSGSKGGTDASRAHAQELLPSNATPKQAATAVSNLKNEMEAQSGAGNDAVSKQVERTKLGNILEAIRGQNPATPGNSAPSAVPDPVRKVLSSVGPGIHKLSDGSTWLKDANGNISKQ